MKRKIGFLVIMLFAVASFTVNSVNNSNKIGSELTSLIRQAYAETEDPSYSCTAKTVCPGLGDIIKCTGTMCSRGSYYVKCDGIQTDC